MKGFYLITLLVLLRVYPNRLTASTKKTIVPSDAGAGKMQHSQIILRLFSPANEQMTKPVKPGVGPFHHPAPGLLPGFLRLDFFSARPDMGRVAVGRHYLPHLGVVVARIQAQALLVPLGQVGLPSSLSGGRQAS